MLSFSSSDNRNQDARHQRRILVQGETLLGRGPDSALVSCCLRWQHEYAGDLYVSVPGQPGAVDGPDSVRLLLAWGLSALSVIFFDRNDPGIARLRAAIGLADADPATSAAVAELLAVGATDVVDPGPGVLRSCRDIALSLNRRLGGAELPVPAEIYIRHRPRPTGGPATTPGSAPTTRSVNEESQAAVDLLAEGHRRVSRDCDQVLDLVDRVRVARSRTVGDRCDDSGQSAIREALAFDVADYVAAARAEGRGQLDPALRERMAQLYEDLRPLLLGDAMSCSQAQLRQLRLAQLVFQNEWKLSDATPTRPFHPWPDLVPEFSGRRNLPYAQMRLLNEVVGVRRHTSDLSVDGQCWDAARYLTASWVAREREALAGDARWSQTDMPDVDELTERLQRLRDMPVTGTGTGPDLRAAAQPPRSWTGYLGRDGRANVLEYLLPLPFGRRYDEGTFLRAIHLTEVATWGILCWIMSANEWCKDGDLVSAAACLDRATPFAELQVRVLQVLRRTMSVERFQAFRDDTGDSSAVQSLGSQLLSIHLFGVHPAKAAALREVPENAFVLLYRNQEFASLWSTLDRIPTDTQHASLVLDAARRLDVALFKWRRMHLGLAYRYLPAQAAGTGGTDGSAYLERFYQQRMFDADGDLRSSPPPTTAPPGPAWLRARPARSPLN